MAIAKELEEAGIPVQQAEANTIVDEQIATKQDVEVLKLDMGVLKQDVGIIKQDVMILKQDVIVLKQDVGPEFLSNFVH